MQFMFFQQCIMYNPIYRSFQPNFLLVVYFNEFKILIIFFFLSFEKQQAACSSYQNTIGRHSTIGPYSHLTGNPYTANGCNNDFSYASQYGYNSWGMWRDSRNLTPSSTYSSKSRSSLKSFTIILMTAAFIVILAVLSVAALAFYFSTFKSDDCKYLFRFSNLKIIQT